MNNYIQKIQNMDISEKIFWAIIIYFIYIKISQKLDIKEHNRATSADVQYMWDDAINKCKRYVWDDATNKCKHYKRIGNKHHCTLCSRIYDKEDEYIRHTGEWRHRKNIENMATGAVTTAAGGGGDEGAFPIIPVVLSVIGLLFVAMVIGFRDHFKGRVKV